MHLPRRALLIAGALMASALTACTSDNGGVTSDAIPRFEPPAVQPDLYQLLPEKIAQQGFVTAASPFTTSPLYFYTGDTGKETGIITDLVKAASAALGVEIQWQQLPYAGLPPALSSGKTDLGVGQFSLTPENLDAVTIITLYETSTSLLQSRTAQHQINTTLDACGLKLGITASSKPDRAAGEQIGEECTRNGLPAPEIVSYPSSTSAQTAVRAQRIAAYIAPTPVAIYEQDKAEFFDVALKSQFGSRIAGFALPKDNRELADAYGAAFDYLASSGKYKEIMSAWGFESISLEKPLLNRK